MLVTVASGWALFSTCGTVIFFGYALRLYNLCCTKYSFVLRCVHWTDAEAAQATALWFGMLSCAVLQRVLFSCLLVRRALAYRALALAFVGHCMYAAAVRLLLAADPGYVFARVFCTATVVIFAGGDLLCFLGLLLCFLRGGRPPLLPCS